MMTTLAAEWNLNMFSTVEANGKAIDMQATFQPGFPFFYIRLAMLIFMFAIFISWSLIDLLQLKMLPSYNGKEYDESFDDFHSLSLWAYIFSAIYFILSLVLSKSSSSFNVQEQQKNVSKSTSASLSPVSKFTKATWAIFVNNIKLLQEQQQNASESTSASLSPVSKLTKATWAIFVININLQVFVCILGLILATGEGLSGSIGHFFIFIALGIDGFYINRTPIRFKQIGFGCIVPIICLISALIGSKDGIMGLALLTVFMPVVFFVIFALSNLLPRRYIEEVKEVAVVEDEEAGKRVSFPVAAN